jgi:chromosome segregation ATPase
LNHGQELKERSRRKSFFICNESGVWAALTRQRALVKEANKRLSYQSAEVVELRVACAVVKEEAAQAREEATQAREALMSLSTCVKELDEDVTLVSRHRDTLNVQIGQVTAHFEALKNEVTTLSGAVRERDEALSNARQEIETLRAADRDRDGALQALEKTCGGLRDEVVGWQTHSEGKFFVVQWPWC